MSLNDSLLSVQRESAKCSRNGRWGPRQTVAHVLLDCPKYAQLRHDFLWQGESTRDLKEILSEPALAKRAALLWLAPVYRPFLGGFFGGVFWGGFVFSFVTIFIQHEYENLPIMLLKKKKNLL